jgi:pimeloyl-ACP methyl ester carboxylesterase
VIERLLPERIDNTFRGHFLAPWLFGLVVVARTLQGLAVTFDTSAVAQRADGIPLDTFAPAAAQTVGALFALTGLYRLVIAVVCVLVLVRYRGALAFLCALLALEGLAKLVLLESRPLATSGTPAGPHPNAALTVLSIVGVALSLWRPGRPPAPADPPRARPGW